jgi:hypothetical protein
MKYTIKDNKDVESVEWAFKVDENSYLSIFANGVLVAFCDS